MPGTEPREEPDKSLLVVVQRFTDQAALALTNASAENLHARLEASLLPSLPIDHPRLQVVTRYRTGEQRLRLGGDFVGSASLPERCAALRHRRRERPWTRRGRVGSDAPFHLEGAGARRRKHPPVIAVMRQVLLAERAEPNAFATIVAGYVDLEDGSLNLANVGHPPPLLITGDRGDLPGYASHALPLGFGDATDGRCSASPCLPRWSLLCYTDGLIDARDGAGLCRALRRRTAEEAPRAPGRPSARTELRSTSSWPSIETASGEPFADDVAFLLISTKDSAGG